MKLSIMKPLLPSSESVTEYLRRIDASRIYSNQGPLVREFEFRLAAHLKIDEERVVVCTNATLALMGALSTSSAARFEAPNFTFAASLLSLHHSNKVGSIVDISLDDWEIFPPSRTTNPSEGILRVLPFGAPVNFEKFKEYQSIVIDAAASFGSSEISHDEMPINTCVVYSFHATKVLGVGEGACVVFGNSEWAREFRSWINFGFNGSRESLNLGINAKMSEFAAAHSLAALDEWAQEKRDWEKAQQSARRVDKKFNCTSIVGHYPGVNPYWIAQFESSEIARLVERILAEDGIESRKWWGGGCHKMSAFRDIINGTFEITELVASTTLGLPLFRGMSEADFSLIEHSLSRAFEQIK
jgi:dTDP-4-amino-4,6-dideoxygalactose transaminase